MSCGPSAECWDSHSCQKTNVCVHLCVYVHVCVCGNCDEAKEWTYCPYCRPPLKRCTWLVGVCMCVYGTAVLQYYMGRVRGETQTNYSCGPGACGNCGLNNVGRESGARGRTREEEKRFTGKRSVYKLRQDEMAKWRENTWQREEKTPEKRICPSVSECSEAGKATETSRRRGPRHNLATRSLQRDMGLETRRQWALIQRADPEPSTTVT